MTREQVIQAANDGKSLAGADLEGLDLSGVDLHGADLKGAYLAMTNLASANLTGADLRDAYFWRTDLTACCMHDAKISLGGCACCLE